MLNLVVSRLDGLLGGHKRGNMAAETHAVGVCALGNRRDPFGLDGTVELDLTVAVLGIEIDALENLGQRLGIPARRVGP